MRHLNKFNEGVVGGKSLNSKFISDIDELVSNLQYLKSFIEEKVGEDDINFFKNANIIHTDI